MTVTRAENTQIQAPDAKAGTIEQKFYGDMAPYLKRALAGSPIDPQYFISACLAVYRSNGALAKCDPRSFLASAYECALLRMPPGGALGLCYIVPRKIKGQLVAQFQLGYKGARTLMYRSQLVSAVRCNVVREGDHFEWTDGLQPILHHAPEGDPEASIVAAWAVIDTSRGGHVPWVMTRPELERVKRRSDAGAKGVGPWAHEDDVAWMCMKTCIVRAAKLAPVEFEIQRAVNLDEAADAGIEQEIDLPIDVEGGSKPNGKPNGNGSAAEAFKEAFGAEADAEGADPEPEIESEPTEDEKAAIKSAELAEYYEEQFRDAADLDAVHLIHTDAKLDLGGDELAAADRKRIQTAYTKALRRVEKKGKR